MWVWVWVRECVCVYVSVSVLEKDSSVDPILLAKCTGDLTT